MQIEIESWGEAFQFHEAKLGDFFLSVYSGKDLHVKLNMSYALRLRDKAVTGFDAASVITPITIDLIKGHVR